jgi:uncharacterized protein YdaU (DUF1376 family)
VGKSPAFPLYASDFYMDTLTWETDDIGVYFCLLMAEWVNGPLEQDTKKLAKIAKKSHKKFLKNWSKISQKFVDFGAGNKTFFINLRLEEEREKQRNFIEKQKLRGIKSGEARRTVVQPRFNHGSTAVRTGGSTKHEPSFSSSSSNIAFISNDIKAGDTPPPASLDEKENQKPMEPEEDVDFSQFDPKNLAMKSEEKKSGHFTDQIADGELINRLQEVCKYWAGKNGFNPWAWIQVGIRKRRHPLAILHTLERLKESVTKGVKIDNMIAYATKIVDIESKNYREADAIAAHERLKKELGKIYPRTQHHEE